MPDATHPSGEDRESDRGRLVAFPSRHKDACVPNNLPLQPSSFIGREKELAEVKRLLEHNRLLTLTGAGGCGKTRLALAAAGELVEGFEDGVWLVELASLSDPDLVPQTVAFALGVREQPGRKLTETLSDHLKSEEALLVLDKCGGPSADDPGRAVALLSALQRWFRRWEIMAWRRGSSARGGAARSDQRSRAFLPDRLRWGRDRHARSSGRGGFHGGVG